MSNLFYLNSNPELKGKTAGNAIVNNISVDEEMAPLPEPITPLHSKNSWQVSADNCLVLRFTNLLFIRPKFI